MEITKPTQKIFNQNQSQKYREDLIELKDKMISLIDKIMNSGFKCKQDRQREKEMAQTVVSKIQELASLHLKDATQKKEDFEPPNQPSKSRRNLDYRLNCDFLELKQSALILIDEMLKIDLNSKRDQQNGYNIAKKLIVKIQTLWRDNLGLEIANKNELKLEDLKVAVEMVKNCKIKNFIGGRITFIAMKNPQVF